MKNIVTFSAQVTTATLALALAPCHAVEYLSIAEAQKISFPEAKEFIVKHVVFTEEEKELIERQSGIPVQNRAQKIWQVVNTNNDFIGWFVVDYVIGKHDLIDYAVAIDKNMQVLDVEILSYRESYGGEIRSQSWLDQFTGKNLMSPLKLHEDITNIGGATLSSRHVTEGIKRILATLNVTQK